MVKQIYESCKEKKIREALANLVKASYSSSESDIGNDDSVKYSNDEMNEEDASIDDDEEEMELIGTNKQQQQFRIDNASP